MGFLHRHNMGCGGSDESSDNNTNDTKKAPAGANVSCCKAFPGGYKDLTLTHTVSMLSMRYQHVNSLSGVTQRAKARTWSPPVIRTYVLCRSLLEWCFLCRQASTLLRTLALLTLH